jgi:hypothetical protein
MFNCHARGKNSLPQHLAGAFVSKLGKNGAVDNNFFLENDCSKALFQSSL